MNDLPAVAKPHRLIAPLDVSRIKNENGVKKLIKELLDFHGWYHWANVTGGFGKGGLSDRHAIKDGVFLAIEAKFGYNKPTPLQKAHAAQVIANNCFAFAVNEKNIDHLAMWLESFEYLKRSEMAQQPPSHEHGSRCINAQAALMELFA